MKTLIILLTALASTQAFAASQLTCRIGESVLPSGPSQDYELSAPVNGNNAQINMPSGRLLNVGFGAETFISHDTAPGKQFVLISATDKNGISSSAGGADTALAFFDTPAGSLFVQCSVQ